MKNATSETEWNVEGMTCTSCANTVTKFLERHGMENVFVDYSSGMVKFNHGNDFNAQEIVKGISGLGYRVANPNSGISKNAFYFLETLEGRFYFCLAFTIPLVLHMLLPWQLFHNAWFQLAMCLPVFIIGIVQFGKSALGSVKVGVPNMDVLIFLGSSAAFIYSFIGGLFLKNPDYLFFETSAGIITLVILGNVIEKRSVARTRSAIQSLHSLQPERAKRIDFYGNEMFEVITEIDQTNVGENEYYLVNSGDRVPADGVIVWGNAGLNESMITGESLPVEKNIGNPVIAGTIVEQGTIKINSTAAGNNTVLSKIIGLVSNAQRNRPHIQRLADRVTSIFVPVVLCISASTFLAAYFFFGLSFQQSLMNSIGVLVISCPCAMGLATPTAIMVGIGRAAQSGILIKGAQTLETLASAKTMVFDKTGTLTTGNFKIQKIVSLGISEESLISVLVSIEKFSSHPIARSICSELKQAELINFKNIKEVKGSHISGEDAEGNIYTIGGSNILATAQDDFRNYNVFVKRNNEIVGMLSIKDEIRSKAKQMIQSLKMEGIKTVMLSGDKNEICFYVAKELGIEEFYSEQKPLQKMQLIEQLRNKGTVVMVGDGINDAPALATATIGISLSGATQVAMDTSQIILLRNDLNLLPEVLKISRHTLLTIKQNLFWAFFYNVLAIPVAAIGLLKPVIAALSMAFSDVIVIGNSLRLKIKKL